MSAIPLSQLTISQQWQSNFLKILPAVKKHASFQFRRLPGDAREEATAEAVASACVAYATLARQKKLDRVYVGNIATNAARAVNGGRHVGGNQSCRCVLNPLTHKKTGVVVTSLSPWSSVDDTWRDLMLESRRVSPADQACFNVDFQEWLKSWPQRDRKIIAMLAAGERGMAVAQKFGLTEGRVSQLRREYEASWLQFQGTATTPPAAA